MTQDDAVGAGHGLELRGMTALIAVAVFDAVREAGSDGAFDGDVGDRLRVLGHGFVCKADDALIAHHAGVRTGLAPDFGLRIRRELLAGFEDDGAVKVVRLLAFRNVQQTIRVEIGLESLRPHLGDDFDGVRPTVLVGPCFDLRPGADIDGGKRHQRREQQVGKDHEAEFHGCLSHSRLKRAKAT